MGLGQDRLIAAATVEADAEEADTGPDGVEADDAHRFREEWPADDAVGLGDKAIELAVDGLAWGRFRVQRAAPNAAEAAG